jgi:hypothetical protein
MHDSMATNFARFDLPELAACDVRDLTFLDFDANGSNELLLACYNTPSRILRFTQGTNYFVALILSNSAANAVACDSNYAYENSRPHIVIAPETSPPVVYAPSGQTSYTTYTSTNMFSGTALAVSLCDVNLEGHLDVYEGCLNGDDKLYLSSGPTEFTVQEITNGGNTRGIAIADVRTNDMAHEIMLAKEGAANVLLYQSDGEPQRRYNFQLHTGPNKSGTLLYNSGVVSDANQGNGWTTHAVANVRTQSALYVTLNGNSHTFPYTTLRLLALQYTREAGYELDGCSADPCVRTNENVTYRILYRNAWGAAPSFARVCIDKNGDGDYEDVGEVNSMSKVTPGTAYARGIIYSYTTQFSDAPNPTNVSYYFWFGDGPNTTVTERVVAPIVDIVPPAITMIYPASNAFVYSIQPTCRWAAVDALTPITNYQIRIDETDWVSVMTATNYIVPFLLREGRHTWQVRATDLMGNTSESPVWPFRVSDQGPVVTIDNPDHAITTRYSTITFSGTAWSYWNVQKVELDPYSTVCTGSSVWWRTESLLIGDNSVSAIATDLAGRLGSADVYIYHDPSAPADTTPPIVLLDQPTAGSTSAVGTVVFAGRAYDNTALTEVRVDGVLARGLGVWKMERVVASGWSSHTVVARDIAGNAATQTVAVFYWSAAPYDGQPPLLTVLSPINGATSPVRQIVLNGTASDNSGVESVKANGMDVEGVTAWRLPTRLNDGMNVIALTARDWNGNMTSFAFTNWYMTGMPADTTPPTVTIDQPTNITFYSAPQMISVNGTAADNVNVTRVALNGESVSGVSVWHWTRQLIGGSNLLVASAFDNSGNSATASVLCIVDTIAPSGVYLRINGGVGYISNVNVVVTLAAQDAYLSAVQLAETPAFAGAAWAPFSSTTNVTLSSGEGTKTLYARFRDMAGNVSAAISNSVVFDETRPNCVGVAVNRDPMPAGAITAAVTFADNLAGMDNGVAPAVYFLSEGGRSGGFSQIAYVGDGWTGQGMVLAGDDGIAYVDALHAADKAGNVMLPAYQITNFLIDTTAPANGIVTINAGAAFVAGSTVTLGIYAEDVLAIQMMLGNEPGFGGGFWEPYATSKAWTLAGGDGSRSVYVKFRDALLNEVHLPFS